MTSKSEDKVNTPVHNNPGYIKVYISAEAV